MPQQLGHYYCLPAQAKPGTAAFCDAEVFCPFKSEGIIVPTFYTRAAQLSG